ncbi:SET domain-containing protein, partial [Cephalotus follicularis]
DEDCGDFLPWLERKAGAKISSVFSIGKSGYGRSLFASKVIRAGDCILKVPFDMQISVDNLLPEIKSSLSDDVGNTAKLAIVVLTEQKLAQSSDWAPYISCLPQPGEMHSTIFWNEGELEMIRQSSVYQETINEKAQIQKKFLSICPALELLPEIFEGVTFEDFIHAYAIVGSRAWGSSKGLTLIPFADFMNHDGASEAIVLSDEDKQLSEVIADHDYSPGEEVLIRYGKYSNATLLLDFGFMLPYNVYDQVQIQLDIPHHDLLRDMKLKFLHEHCTRSMKGVNHFDSSEGSFTVKEVKSARGKGKGLTSALRAFARVLCCRSPEELNDLVMEAAQNDGRMAIRPLRNSDREIQAHQILSSQFTQLIGGYYASVKLLRPINSPSICNTSDIRRQMARDLLTGKLCILKSASTWVKNYCSTLIDTDYPQQ